jgi:hypothetical protein
VDQGENDPNIPTIQDPARVVPSASSLSTSRTRPFKSSTSTAAATTSFDIDKAEERASVESAGGFLGILTVAKRLIGLRKKLAGG